MAYELVEEVLDHAPEALGQAERLALVIIAEKARKGTRAADIAQDVFLRRMGIGDRGLRKVFERLESHGLEVRVPLGVLKDGRPLYAIPGHVCSFVLPPLAPSKKAANPSTEEGGTTVPPPFVGGTLVPNQGTTVPNQGTTVPNQGTRVPPNQTGETEGLSPVHSEKRRTLRPPPGPHPQADLISSMRSNAKEASRKKQAQANGTRPGSFGALMNYQINPGEKRDAQEPGL